MSARLTMGECPMKPFLKGLLATLAAAAVTGLAYALREARKLQKASES